jgi:hypothetical protein
VLSTVIREAHAAAQSAGYANALNAATAGGSKKQKVESAAISADSAVQSAALSPLLLAALDVAHIRALLLSWRTFDPWAAAASAAATAAIDAERRSGGSGGSSNNNSSRQRVSASLTWQRRTSIAVLSLIDSLCDYCLSLADATGSAEVTAVINGTPQALQQRLVEAALSTAAPGGALFAPAVTLLRRVADRVLRCGRAPVQRDSSDNESIESDRLTALALTAFALRVWDHYLSSLEAFVAAQPSSTVEPAHCVLHLQLLALLLAKLPRAECEQLFARTVACAQQLNTVLTEQAGGPGARSALPRLSHVLLLLHFAVQHAPLRGQSMLYPGSASSSNASTDSAGRDVHMQLCMGFTEGSSLPSQSPPSPTTSLYAHGPLVGLVGALDVGGNGSHSLLYPAYTSSIFTTDIEKGAKAWNQQTVAVREALTALGAAAPELVALLHGVLNTACNVGGVRGSMLFLSAWRLLSALPPPEPVAAAAVKSSAGEGDAAAASDTTAADELATLRSLHNALLQLPPLPQQQQQPAAIARSTFGSAVFKQLMSTVQSSLDEWLPVHTLRQLGDSSGSRLSPRHALKQRDIRDWLAPGAHTSEGGSSSTGSAGVVAVPRTRLQRDTAHAALQAFTVYVRAASTTAFLADPSEGAAYRPMYTISLNIDESDGAAAAATTEAAAALVPALVCMRGVLLRCLDYHTALVKTAVAASQPLFETVRQQVCINN